MADRQALIEGMLAAHQDSALVVFGMPPFHHFVGVIVNLREAQDCRFIRDGLRHCLRLHVFVSRFVAHCLPRLNSLTLSAPHTLTTLKGARTPPQHCSAI